MPTSLGAPRRHHQLLLPRQVGVCGLGQEQERHRQVDRGTVEVEGEPGRDHDADHRSSDPEVLESLDQLRQDRAPQRTGGPDGYRRGPELFETRRALDPEAIALACECRTDADFAGTQEALTHLLPVTPQWGEAALIAHREVHQAIYVASHNTVLIRLLDDLWDKVRPVSARRPRAASGGGAPHS